MICKSFALKGMVLDEINEVLIDEFALKIRKREDPLKVKGLLEERLLEKYAGHPRIQDYVRFVSEISYRLRTETKEH